MGSFDEQFTIGACLSSIYAFVYMCRYLIYYLIAFLSHSKEHDDNNESFVHTSFFGYKYEQSL